MRWWPIISKFTAKDRPDFKVNNHNKLLAQLIIIWRNRERSGRFSRAAPTWKEKWRLTFKQWILFILFLWKVLKLEMTIQKHSYYIKKGLFSPPLIISVIKLNDDKSWQVCGQHWSEYNWTALRKKPYPRTMSNITMRNKNCISRVLFKQGVHAISWKNEPEYLAWMLRYCKSNLLCFKTEDTHISVRMSQICLWCYGHTHCDKHISMCCLLKAMNQSSFSTIKAEMRCDYYYTKYCVVNVPIFLVLCVFYCWSLMSVLWPYNP